MNFSAIYFNMNFSMKPNKILKVLNFNLLVIQILQKRFIKFKSTKLFIFGTSIHFIKYLKTFYLAVSRESIALTGRNPIYKTHKTSFLTRSRVNIS